MRRLFCLLIVLSAVMAASGCSGKDMKTTAESLPSIQTQPAKSEPAITEPAPTEISADPSSETTTGTVGSSEGVKGELLQSASIDLDRDGANEQVQVLQAEVDDPSQAGTKELEGILRIEGKKGTKEVVYVKKTIGVTGVLNSIDFKDLDGDGIKDIFITIPDAGASFAINYYYVYNYENDKSYTFNIDAALTDFAGGFQFSYEGKGMLRINNDSYGFTARFNLNDSINGIDPDENANSDYERSWVDSTPVVISEDSKVSLVQSGKIAEIKVPLPVFGLSAANMIGEVDMFFAVGADFTPDMTRFEVSQFNKDMKPVKIGEWVKK